MIATPSRTPRFKDPGKEYLEYSYEELQEKNLDIRNQAESGDDTISKNIKEQLLALGGAVKAVTVYFTDLEGKLHDVDYDKDYILDAEGSITFDGSSINGFSSLDNSDLKLSIDWSSFRWPPADIFGAGKVIVFADILDQDGKPYNGDFRSRLKNDLTKIKKKQNIIVNFAPEIEGILLEGRNVEQHFDSRIGLKPASEGGYYNALPQDPLRIFIDQLAEATRALGFKNEKDHPEVAPGQFELNYKHRHAIHAADQIQLYKICARQIAANMGYTATFLPKPGAKVNGNGMHMNISLQIEGKNIFYDANGENNLSETARMFIAGVLLHGKEICLALNSSVNAYRRLDPKFEAPNEIKTSASDRSAMIRVPMANENATRMEVRSVAPDANPYLATMLIIRAGMEAILESDKKKIELSKLLKNDNRDIETLPGNIQDAISLFRESPFIEEVMGTEHKNKFIDLKEAVADRSPKELGTRVKKWEILDHHEVRNQSLSKVF